MALSELTKALMLQQQPRGGLSVRVVVLGGGLVAAGVAFYSYGLWGSWGWVTPVRLEEGLESVRAFVRDCYERLRAQLEERFGLVDAGLTALTSRVDEVSAEIKGEVQSVGEGVGALEQRLDPIERDVRRTAKGVGLLCEVVAGLTSNANPELIKRLDDYTGNATVPLAPREREPLAPLRHESLRQELVMPVHSGLLSAILAPPSGAPPTVKSW